ncbi:MAG TPA: FxsA family protein [Aestuariivirga sp.]|nr:FxsA family protein [Aestuariivirga sp.]
MVRTIGLGLLLLGFAEIATLVAVGRVVGVLGVLLLLVVAGMTGISLIRQSGLSIMMLGRSGLNARMASEQAATGVTTFAAGLLFLLPGFVSDAAALLLLLPPVRNRLSGWLERHMVVTPTRSAPGAPGPVIEGEGQVIHEGEILPPPGSRLPPR